MKLKKSSFTLSILIGFLTGVLMYQVAQPGFQALLWAIGVALFVVIPSIARNFTINPLQKADKVRFLVVLRSSRNDVWLLVFLFIVAVALGLGRAKFAEHQVTPDQIDFYNGKKIEFEGVITEVDVRRDKAKYTIRVQETENLPTGQAGWKQQGNVLISLAKYPQYRYGDRLRVKGELEAPGEFEDFSYNHYLSRFGIYSVMGHPRVELVAAGQGNSFWSAMVFLQNKFLDRINRLFPEPHGSFMAGLLVGARKGISEDWMEKFSLTGLTHILAISGFNISIVIAVVLGLLKPLPRRIGFAAAFAAIVLFTLFTGASPSVVRASIMGILGLVALNTGRQNQVTLTILFTAFFMVLWNPKILWWDVGFQLSFLAVLGLVYVAPLFKRFTQKLPEAFGIREAILMTLSAQVMALPIILYNFDRLSLIAPLSNLFVAFAIPPAMAFGFLAVMASFIFYPLALLIAYAGWGILSYILKVIDFTASIPYASVNWEGMQTWMIAGYYLLLGFFLYCHSKRASARV